MKNFLFHSQLSVEKYMSPYKKNSKTGTTLNIQIIDIYAWTYISIHPFSFDVDY